MLLEALVCLSLNIYHEARGETPDGQTAVAQVTLNRVADPAYPDDVCAVVYDPHQFSWTTNPPPVTEPEALARALWIAVTATTTDDLVDGATHYYSLRIDPPYWTSSMVWVGKIDNHSFYR